jgi:hypothetical protein
MTVKYPEFFRDQNSSLVDRGNLGQAGTTRRKNSPEKLRVPFRR